jgi:hypothetical protein
MSQQPQNSMVGGWAILHGHMKRYVDQHRVGLENRGINIAFTESSSIITFCVDSEAMKQHLEPTLKRELGALPFMIILPSNPSYPAP